MDGSKSRAVVLTSNFMALDFNPLTMNVFAKISHCKKWSTSRFRNVGRKKRDR